MPDPPVQIAMESSNLEGSQLLCQHVGLGIMLVRCGAGGAASFIRRLERLSSRCAAFGHSEVRRRI
jgi:hypothetical protein